MKAQTDTEPNAYFEVRTNSGEIFGPFPHSWQWSVNNCAVNAVPLALRNLGTDHWESRYLLKPFDLPGFVPPAEDAMRDEWFRLLRAVARECCKSAQWPAIGHNCGFDPLAVEYAGFACVSAISSPEVKAHFDYENGGKCRASISVMQITNQPQTDSALDKILTIAEEWEKSLEKRKGTDEFLDEDFANSGKHRSDLERFQPDFYFRFCAGAIQRNAWKP